MPTITLNPLGLNGLAWAQGLVTAHHYLHRPVDPRCSPEGYSVHIPGVGPVGVLIFGRPEATVCRPFYGGLDDLAAGRVACSRWQVLNLARVWLAPEVQAGGRLHRPDLLPGFVDRRGVWRSVLASTVVRLALARVGYDYLVHRPPVWIEQPFELRYVLSYCDPQYHKGTLYRSAGFQLYRVNARGLQTWRTPVPPLTAEQDDHIRQLAAQHPRSQRLRARHAAAHGPHQLALEAAA